MQAKAICRNVRIAPRKARLVADLIRGKSIEEALGILRFTNRAASPILSKLVNSATANAENNHGAKKVEDLVVKTIFVDEGPTMKRFRPCARGRAGKINKRSSHITVVVAEK